MCIYSLTYVQFIAEREIIHKQLNGKNMSEASMQAGKVNEFNEEKMNFIYQLKTQLYEKLFIKILKNHVRKIHDFY